MNEIKTGVVQFSVRLKEAFFDKPAVIQIVGKDRARLLRNAGGFVRSTASNSMRRAKPRASGKIDVWSGRPVMVTSSAPGAPPNVHSNDKFATLRNILYAYNASNDGIVVGPVGLKAVHGGKTVPELHEKGGPVVIRERAYVGSIAAKANPKWQLDTNRGNRDRWWIRRRRTKIYPPRTFMKPAIQKMVASGNFPELFFGSGGSE